MSVDFSSDLRGLGEELNLNNANAVALLDAMGFDWKFMCGECSIPEARRGVIRARNRGSLVRFERLAINEHRCFSPEFTADDLVERINRFAALVEKCAAAGAKVIRWS